MYSEFDKIAPFYDDLPIAAGSSQGLFLRRLPARRRAALDAGCGTGRLISCLGELFEVVVGIDASLQMVLRAKGRLGSCVSSNMLVLVMDVEALAFPRSVLRFRNSPHGSSSFDRPKAFLEGDAESPSQGRQGCDCRDYPSRPYWLYAIGSGLDISSC